MGAGPAVGTRIPAELGLPLRPLVAVSVYSSIVRFSSASRVESDASDELRRLGEADQSDRHAGLFHGLVERDAARRARVHELVEAGSLGTADDHFHAALAFQHGESAPDYWRAHELAKVAADLGHPQGRWLAAAALDRWLVRQGRPQKYGTQYQVVAGRWTLREVDPETTDEERAAWQVKPLAEAEARAERMTRDNPPRSWPV